MCFSVLWSAVSFLLSSPFFIQDSLYKGADVPVPHILFCDQSQCFYSCVVDIAISKDLFLSTTDVIFEDHVNHQLMITSNQGFIDPVLLKCLQGSYNVPVLCPANTSRVTSEDTAYTRPQQDNGTLVGLVAPRLPLSEAMSDDEDCTTTAISVFATQLAVIGADTFITPDGFCHSIKLVFLVEHSDPYFYEEAKCMRSEHLGNDTAIVVWSPSSSLAPDDVCDSGMGAGQCDFDNSSSSCHCQYDQEDRSVLPKKSQGDPEMILVTKEVFYTYFVIVTLVVASLHVNNCATFSEGKKTEKMLNNKIAVYEAIEGKCFTLYQDMSAEARKEKTALQCVRKKLRASAAEKAAKFQSAQRYQCISYNAKLAKKALAAEKEKVNAHIAKLMNEIGNIKKENDGIQQQLNKHAEIMNHFNMAKELEVQEGVKAIQSQAKDAVNAMKEKVSKLKASKKATDEKIRETSDKLKSTEAKLHTVSYEIDKKEHELAETIEQTRRDISKYKLWLGELKSKPTDFSVTYMGPDQPAITLRDSDPTTPDGFDYSYKYSPLSSSSSSSSSSGQSAGKNVFRRRITKKTV